MDTKDRGFASMDRKKQREMASKGGRRAHELGRAHEFTHEEAVAAGRKGGLEVWRRKKAKAAAAKSGGDDGVKVA